MKTNPLAIQDTSNSPISRVFGRVNYERKTPSTYDREFKLDTIRLILSRLGNPQLQLNVVHIAGTKGKGSTANFVSRIGTELGLKTAIYSSPHFERYTERFSIQNEEVAESVLNPVLEKVLNVVEQIDSEIEKGDLRLPPATFFDISTSAAFLLFESQNVELVALEVGLGGRLDSTNVCDSMATIITSISLDHTKQLGSTPKEIAKEKAAIIKSAVPSICGPVDQDVDEVIRAQANSVGATLLTYGNDFSTTVDTSSPELNFDYEDSSGNKIDSLSAPLLGAHQAQNASLAIAALSQILPKLAVAPTFDFASAVRQGISKTTLPGRLQVVSSDPFVVVDMSHNEASIAAMIQSLQARRLAGKAQAIFSCVVDKDEETMIRQLSRFFDRVILTELPDHPRAQSLDVLNRSVELVTNEGSAGKALTTWLTSDQPKTALQKALGDRTEYAVTVICGSIFLAGEVMSLFRQTDLWE